MKIYVKAAGFHLDKLTGKRSDGWYEMEIEDQSRIQDIIAELDVRKEEGITYMLNGNHAEDNTILGEADELLFLRMLYGG